VLRGGRCPSAAFKKSPTGEISSEDEAAVWLEHGGEGVLMWRCGATASTVVSFSDQMENWGGSRGCGSLVSP